jgi:hypothetical protein
VDRQAGLVGGLPQLVDRRRVEFGFVAAQIENRLKNSLEHRLKLQ